MSRQYQEDNLWDDLSADDQVFVISKKFINNKELQKMYTESSKQSPNMWEDFEDWFTSTAPDDVILFGELSYDRISEYVDYYEFEIPSWGIKGKI